MLPGALQVFRRVSRAHPTADTLVVETSAFVIRKREHGPTAASSSSSSSTLGTPARAPGGQEAHVWELVQVDVNVVHQLPTREQQVQVRNRQRSGRQCCALLALRRPCCDRQGPRERLLRC